MSDQTDQWKREEKANPMPSGVGVCDKLSLVPHIEVTINHLTFEGIASDLKRNNEIGQDVRATQSKKYPEKSTAEIGHQRNPHRPSETASADGEADSEIILGVGPPRPKTEYCEQSQSKSY
jgi:hypothetical protein